MSLNIVGLMGLNIRGLVETGKRENAGGFCCRELSAGRLALVGFGWRNPFLAFAAGMESAAL